MAHFHIENLGAYNGDHEMELESLTNRELHTLKKISGVRAGELDEAFEAGDNDVLVAFLVIVLERKGHKPVNVDVIWDAPGGSIDFITDEEEKQQADDAGPPSQEPSEPAADVSENENNDFSGDRSSNVSALPVSDPSRTGAPSSATGSDSVPQTSAI